MFTVSNKRILISMPISVSNHAESNPGSLGNKKHNNKTEANEFTRYGESHNYGIHHTL